MPALLLERGILIQVEHLVERAYKRIMPTSLAGKIRAIKRRKKAKALRVALALGLLSALLMALVILGMNWIAKL